VVTSATFLIEAVLTLFPSSIVVAPTRLSVAGALNLFNIFPSSLEVVLLPLNPILDMFVYKELNAIVVRLIRVPVYKDFDFLELLARDLAIVFQGTVYYF
jgi:hypothetical protein